MAETSGSLFHRSGTEQLEHWAMLGAALEQVMGLNSVARLKTISQSEDLDRMLAAAGTPGGNRKLAAILEDEKEYGYRAPGQISARKRRRTKGLTGR